MRVGTALRPLARSAKQSLRIWWISFGRADRLREIDDTWIRIQSFLAHVVVVGPTTGDALIVGGAFAILTDVPHVAKRVARDQFESCRLPVCYWCSVPTLQHRTWSVSGRPSDKREKKITRHSLSNDSSVRLSRIETRVCHFHVANRRRGMTVHRRCTDTVEEDEEDLWIA